MLHPVVGQVVPVRGKYEVQSRYTGRMGRVGGRRPALQRASLEYAPMKAATSAAIEGEALPLQLYRLCTNLLAQSSESVVSSFLFPDSLKQPSER